MCVCNYFHTQRTTNPRNRAFAHSELLLEAYFKKQQIKKNKTQQQNNLAILPVPTPGHWEFNQKQSLTISSASSQKLTRSILCFAKYKFLYHPLFQKSKA